MDANDNFEISPQEFDAIMQDANNKRHAEVNTSTRPGTAKTTRVPNPPPHQDEPGQGRKTDSQ